LLRGSSDFGSVESYREFLEQVLERVKEPLRTHFREEPKFFAIFGLLRIPL
jgi:hypothetical protein